MRPWILSVILLIVLLPMKVWGVSLPQNSVTVEQVEKVAARDFKDPDTVKFRDVTFHPHYEKTGELVFVVLCGEVNAKNSYGAYTGFKSFTYMGNGPDMHGDISVE